ncbi:MAG TPA: DinB family protein [Chloroflexota bacterium]|nr:DinB family protein [Chloroflexota bacterium]
MDALAFLREQSAQADRNLRQVFTPVMPDQAQWRLAGSTANTIGATFMHAYFSEDQMVQDMRGASSIFENGGWRDRLGYDHSNVWTFEGRHDPRLLLEYAEAVAAATEAFLAELDPAALDDVIDTPRGPQPRARRLSVYLVHHKAQHAGEIAALLGCQGVKGLPF